MDRKNNQNSAKLIRHLELTVPSLIFVSLSFTHENLNQNYLDAFSELSFLYFGSESTDCRAWPDIFVIKCRQAGNLKPQFSF